MVKKIIITGVFIVSTVTMATAQIKGRPLALKDTIKDNSIEIPPDLERDLDQLLIDWKKDYRKDPTCIEGPQYDIIPDSVYINRLYTLPSEMELVYNQIVRSYIEMYTTRRKTSVEYMLTKGKYYFPIIEETFDKYRLPLELKFLPVIESALNPIAKSRVGATGLWQFMLPTGRMYDLEVNTLVDERKDPRKSTEAAARYLKDLFDIYGDWNLVIAAYNCGPGNVNKAIKRSGGLTDYWAIYPYLPRETRGYVPAFIAATYVMNYYSKHNICPAEEAFHPISVDTVWVDKRIHLKQISETLNYPIEDLRGLNPQYQKDVIPGDYKQYPLCLPSKTISDFITNEESILSYNSEELLSHRKTVEVENNIVVSSSSGKATKTHKVRRGESLGTIANKYGVSVTHLKKMNNLKSNKITAGRNLIINRQVINKTPKKQDQPNTENDNNNVLAENDKTAAKKQDNKNLSASADSTSNQFFADYYNSKKVDNDSIVVADNINIKETEADNSQQARNNFDDTRIIYHKVKIGETVVQIANKYNVSTKDILAWNKMSSKKAKIGQRLMVKLPEKAKIEVNKAHKETKEPVEIKKGHEQTTVKDMSIAQIAPKKQKTKALNTVYRVQKGDSLYIIAKKYKNISPKDIMLANNLKSNKLSVGQELKIPTN